MIQRKLAKVFLSLGLLVGISAQGQVRPDAIYGDYKGYWISKDNSTSYVTADDNNNLLGFTIGTVNYSTGIDPVLFGSKVGTYVNENYRAFPTSLTTSSGGTSYFIGTARYQNGVQQTQEVRPSISCDIPLSYYLRDGKNGLDLSTAMFNIPTQELSFLVNVLADINPTCISDNIPDIIVTQVGQPGAKADVFKFTDVNGNTVGNPISVIFDGVTPSGKALWNFYNVSGCPHAYNTGAGLSNTTRDVRMLTFKLSDFGITATNYSSAVRFVQVLSGDSDVAFSAYSANSMSMYCLESANNVGLSVPTKLGITTLGRAGVAPNEWPQARTGGFIALESSKKGFVPTRMSTAELANIQKPVEGMMVYDTTDNCLKIYVGALVGWKCFNRKTCP